MLFLHWKLTVTLFMVFKAEFAHVSYTLLKCTFSFVTHENLSYYLVCIFVALFILLLLCRLLKQSTVSSNTYLSSNKTEIIPILSSQFISRAV